MSPTRTVTLNWRGKSTASRLHPGPARALPLAPPRLANPATRWSAPDGSALLQGDNLTVLRTLFTTHREQVTLAYLDPPFLTNRVFEAVDRKTGKARVAFDDRWPDRAAYLEALGPRLVAIRELLAVHGSVVIHVDPKTSHYVKVLADEVFGEDAFASEIIWRYRRWPAKTPNFQRVHDVLLRYRKDVSMEPRWNPLFEPLAASTLATWGTTKQRAVFAQDGTRSRSSRTTETTAGVPLGDVWDIGVLAPVARERTGYPSQKPEALLDRLLLALSNPGDLVLDPYAGSGTTLAVAAKRGRRFLGIDQSDVAIETTLARLEALGGPLRLTVEDLARPPRARDETVRAAPCASPGPKISVARGMGPSLSRAKKRPSSRGSSPSAAPDMVLSRVR